jgi:hypothetical protein
VNFGRSNTPRPPKKIGVQTLEGLSTVVNKQNKVLEIYLSENPRQIQQNGTSFYCLSSKNAETNNIRSLTRVAYCELYNYSQACNIMWVLYPTQRVGCGTARILISKYISVDTLSNMDRKKKE